MLESMTQWLDVNNYKKVNLTPSFDGIYTNAIYEVLNWTNVAGLLLPQNFKAVNYFPDGNKIIFEGIANGVLTNSNAKIGLVVPTRTRVYERRFGDNTLTSDEFVYNVTNGILSTKKQLLKDSKK